MTLWQLPSCSASTCKMSSKLLHRVIFSNNFDTHITMKYDINVTAVCPVKRNSFHLRAHLQNFKSYYRHAIDWHRRCISICCVGLISSSLCVHFLLRCCSSQKNYSTNTQERNPFCQYHTIIWFDGNSTLFVGWIIILKNINPHFNVVKYVKLTVWWCP